MKLISELFETRGVLALSEGLWEELSAEVRLFDKYGEDVTESVSHWTDVPVKQSIEKSLA